MAHFFRHAGFPFGGAGDDDDGKSKNNFETAPLSPIDWQRFEAFLISCSLVS
jgi:hypothetical protein